MEDTVQEYLNPAVQNMGDRGEDQLELAEAEKDFIAYLEKSKEKEIRVWQTFFHPII